MLLFLITQKIDYQRCNTFVPLLHVKFDKLVTTQQSLLKPSCRAHPFSIFFRRGTEGINLYIHTKTTELPKVKYKIITKDNKISFKQLKREHCHAAFLPINWYLLKLL